MFFLGGNFVSSLIWTLKSKKPVKKPLKTYKKTFKKFLKKPRFFPALDQTLIYRQIINMITHQQHQQ